MKYENKKWITTTVNVDTNTGEIISNKLRDRDYVILRKSKKYKEDEKYRIIEYTNECERDRQQRIW